MSRLVAGASGAAALLAAHSVVNWRLLRKVPAVPCEIAARPSASVLIPCRDEVERLGPTLESVLMQRDVDLEVIVLDDGSTDGTADLARRIGGAFPRFRVVEGRALPPGWLGKPHACHQLAELATGEVLVFLDAEVVLAPSALAGALDILVQGEVDLLSPYPRQVVGSAAERLVQPLLQWSWLTFLPLRLAERLRAPSLTAANGQLLLCRADAYRAVGGHAQIRAEVIEDVALARLFKQAGLTVAMADGTALATCRMYEGWEELRDGYAKSLWSAFGSRTGAVGAVALLSLLYLLPPAALLAGLVGRRRQLVVSGGAGYLAATAGRAFTARRTGGRIADAPAHPASIAVLAWLVARSWRQRARGGLTWKGRPVG